MRYLILTDIHANLEGLETCLKDARTRGYDETLVLGDIVGYGPEPDGVVARLSLRLLTASGEPVAALQRARDLERRELRHRRQVRRESSADSPNSYSWTTIALGTYFRVFFL
jgi:hypothetical protein